MEFLFYFILVWITGIKNRTEQKVRTILCVYFKIIIRSRKVSKAWSPWRKILNKWDPPWFLQSAHFTAGCGWKSANRSDAFTAVLAAELAYHTAVVHCSYCLLSIVQGNLLLLLSICCLMSIVQGDLLAPRDLADCAPRLDGLHGEHRDAGQWEHRGGADGAGW